MGFNKSPANGKSKAKAVRWGEFRYSIKFIEDPAKVFRRDAHAPINNQDL